MATLGTIFRAQMCIKREVNEEEMESHLADNIDRKMYNLKCRDFSIPSVQKNSSHLDFLEFCFYYLDNFQDVKLKLVI